MRTSIVEQAEELERLRELRRVAAEFKANQIEAIVYKGTALAYKYYPQPYMRKRCDTDLMIDESQIAKAKAALQELGYFIHLASDQGTISHQFAAEKEVNGLRHVVDVHWKFSNRPLFAETFQYRSMRDEAAPLPAFGDGVRIAGKVDSLIIACLHPVMHHFGHFDMDWVEDLDRLLCRFSPTDYKRLVARSRELGVSTIIAKVLRDTGARRKYLLPEDVVMMLERDGMSQRQAARFQRGAKNMLAILWLDFWSLDSWSKRWSFLKAHLVPGEFYMRAKFTKPGEEVSLLTLHVRRWLGGFRSLFKTGAQSA